MDSLENSFKELRDRLNNPDLLNPAKSDPIFYFVYKPSQILEVKRRLNGWIGTLRSEGFKVQRVSFSDLLWELIDNSGRWDSWLEVEGDYALQEVNESIRDVLRANNSLVNRVAELVSQETNGKAVLLFTEAEFLHPYFRTRSIESQLHDRVKTPTVIFYPGRRTGLYGLHFMDYYPEDGNYRSTIIGGIE